MLQISIVTFLLFFTSIAVAFEPNVNKGVECHLKKDYQCALRHFKPLANQGDDNAQFHLQQLGEYEL